MDRTEPPAADIDLTTCDREPVHIPGAIQPHGVLLVLAEPELRILQASASLRAHVGLNAMAMLGQSLALLLDGPSLGTLRAALGRDLAEPQYLPVLVTSTGRRFEALVHRTPAGLILELEPDGGGAALDIVRVIRDTLAEVHRAATLAAVCQAAAERLRALTGFDRVMVYRFRPDDAGTVIAEARRDDLPPYLHLTFPATDIPAQVRQLLLLNPLRVRKGNEDACSPVLPALNPVTGAPLDMSRCALRATSPVHLEYLRNMGVGASLTLSVVQNGRLWGLFACHHCGMKYVPHAHRLACESLGTVLALQIEARQRAEQAEGQLRSHDWLLRALHTASGSTCLTEALLRLGPLLSGIVNADGVVIWSDERPAVFGTTPDPGQVAGLIAWLGEQIPDGVFATSALGHLFPPAGAYADRGSGVLALPLAPDARDWIVWFRGELVRTVSWAGDPRKPGPDQDSGERLVPRVSFAAWAEAVRGQSEAWNPAELAFVQALHQALSDIVAGRSRPPGP